MLKELCEKPLLVINEIGRTKSSDFELNWLSYVINKRHENMLPLVLISNRHLMENCAEGEKGCQKCLENFFDNDVISRIIEDGLVIKFTGGDYRMKIRRGGRE
jgi:DNA replication protein DnaC